MKLFSDLCARQQLCREWISVHLAETPHFWQDPAKAALVIRASRSCSASAQFFCYSSVPACLSPKASRGVPLRRPRLLIRDSLRMARI